MTCQWPQTTNLALAEPSLLLVNNHCVGRHLAPEGRGTASKHSFKVKQAFSLSIAGPYSATKSSDRASEIFPGKESSAPASAGGTDRDLAVLQFTQNAGIQYYRVLNITNSKFYNVL